MTTFELRPGGHQTASPLRLARAALTRLLEPSDLVGLALLAVAGPEQALAFIRSGASSSPDLERGMTTVLENAGVPRWPGLPDALSRWRPRLATLAPERDLWVVERLGGGLLIPEDPGWPAALEDLELAAPVALWWRGRLPSIPPIRRCIAVVGSRDASNYGANIAAELAAGLVQRGLTVVSGGAYGIDAQAHRGALAVSGVRDRGGRTDRDATALTGEAPGGEAPGGEAAEQPAEQPATLALMAGGVDRFYPTGNEELLRAVTEQGAMIAEVPPGSNPTRYRFLQRNRLIAALCSVTVVVEARWRSGALNTAHHAEALSRSVGTVPGSVYSANSAGCHRLLREGSAVCVTDTDDVAELAGLAGEHLTMEPEGPLALHDGLGVDELLLLDALPLHSTTTVDRLSAVAGLGTAAILAGLGRLELTGLARREADGWIRGTPH